MTSTLQGGLVLMVSTSIKECTFKYFEKEKKDFFTKMDKKVFVTKYFIFALKLFTVVFERSDRSISTDDTKGVFICNTRGQS